MGGEVAYIIGRMTASMENCLNGDKAEVVQSTLRSLLDRLKRKNYFNGVDFPINYLTYAIEYAEVRPVEPIRKYIIDRLDAEKSPENSE